MTNPNKKNTKAAVKTIEIPEAEHTFLYEAFCEVLSMYTTLTRYYDEESKLKKHHRAYLHVREEAEQKIDDDYAKLAYIINKVDAYAGKYPKFEEIPACKITPIEDDDFIDSDFDDFEDLEDEDDLVVREIQEDNDDSSEKVDGDDMVVMRYNDLSRLQADMIDLIDTVDDLTELFGAMLTVVTKLASFGNPDAFALVTEAKLTADHIFEKLENSKLEKID
ncbi:MAG: hypothetical protein J6L84_04555 [Clostridiales bacterium]|nr:hypothetical protein [Clostridiales bacterium]